VTTDRQREQVGRPFTADLSAYVQPVATTHNHSPQRVLDRVMPTPKLCHAELRGLGFPEEAEDLEIAHAA
jgi:hypothetical protein